MRIIHCRLCDDLHSEDMRECPCCCGGCGGEIDSEGNCPKYCECDDPAHDPHPRQEEPCSPG